MLEYSSSDTHTESPHNSIPARVPHLIYNTKWFAPLAYAILFGFIVGVGALWGAAVNSPHPSLGDLPLYPGAQALTDQQGSIVSALSTNSISRPAPTVSYHFETTDGSSDVVNFYKRAMERTYGFVGTYIEQPDPNTTILHFGRSALRDVWVVELVTVTIRANQPNPTTVELRAQVNW